MASEEDRINEAKKVTYRDVAEKVMGIYSDEAVRDSLAANEKTDKLSGILIQMGFASAGLSAARVIGNFNELPYTVLAVIFAILSMISGSVQFILDHIFYIRYAKSSRNIASSAFLAWIQPSIEADASMKKNLSVHGELPKRSSLIPIILQITFLLISALLTFSELNKKF